MSLRHAQNYTPLGVVATLRETALTTGFNGQLDARRAASCRLEKFGWCEAVR